MSQIRHDFTLIPSFFLSALSFSTHPCFSSPSLLSCYLSLIFCFSLNLFLSIFLCCSTSVIFLPCSLFNSFFPPLCPFPNVLPSFHTLLFLLFLTCIFLLSFSLPFPPFLFFFSVLSALILESEPENWTDPRGNPSYVLLPVLPSLLFSYLWASLPSSIPSFFYFFHSTILPAFLSFWYFGFLAGLHGIFNVFEHFLWNCHKQKAQQYSWALLSLVFLMWAKVCADSSSGSRRGQISFFSCGQTD